jgi:hypothetical protein
VLAQQPDRLGVPGDQDDGGVHVGRRLPDAVGGLLGVLRPHLHGAPVEGLLRLPAGLDPGDVERAAVEGAAVRRLVGGGGIGVHVAALAVDGDHDVRELVVAVDDEAQRVGHRQHPGAVGGGRLGQREDAQDLAGGGEQRLPLRSRHLCDAADHLVEGRQRLLVGSLFGERPARAPPAQLDLLVGVVRRTAGVQVHGDHRALGLVQGLKKRKIHGAQAGWLTPFHGCATIDVAVRNVLFATIWRASRCRPSSAEEEA